ncbi:MAG: hypothetical protein LKK00_09385 [Intestinimonas sp.]|jgi:hypothetical protein|nr:hypothetical protein [Intestinimonas sp.]
MESKKTASRSDLYFDAFVAFDCAVNLLNTVEAEHFESVDALEEWGDSFTYECVFRKIHAVSSILNNAFELLSVAESNRASGHFNAKIELMADLIRGEQQERQAHEKG